MNEGVTRVALFYPSQSDHSAWLSQIREYLLKNQKNRVFEVNLQELLDREGSPDPPIPWFVKSLIEFLDTKNEAEGIFRIAGSRSSMETLRSQIDKGVKLDYSGYQEYQSVHTLASLLKLFFRLLPEPLLTFDAYDPLISLSEKATDADDLQKRMSEVLGRLPYANRYLARYLIEFLGRVATKSHVNMM